MKNSDMSHPRKRSRDYLTNAEGAELSEEQRLSDQHTEGKGVKSSSTSRISPDVPDDNTCGCECTTAPTVATTSTGNSGGSPGGTHPVERKLKQATLPSYGLANDVAVFRKEIADREAQIDELREKLAAVETRMSERETTLINTQAQLQEAVERNNRYQIVLREEMLRAARQGRCDARRALHLKHFDLGQIAVWHGNGREVWVEGNKMRQLTMQLEELTVRRDEVEELKKAAEKRVRQILRSNDEDSMTVEAQAALMEAQEAALLYTAEFATLGSTIQSLKQQQHEISYEKKAFLKEIRRINDEDASGLVAVPTLGHNGRYVMMHLLGKGGFSEVWKAFDLQEVRYVACKIHRVQREWSQQVRQHYRDRAVRELKIMRMLEHPHLTRLFDAFDHGTATFVSVMEFSAGTDLDTHLKRCGTLREAEARLIIMQIASALRYFAIQDQPVIHYDLKPANILFHSSNQSSLLIKITDFGLSKLIPNREGPSDNPTIELTSQGTGTYWYLPPECFDTAATPRISNKVDVWSCGVIFYQMLFGRRPFAEGESQQQIWQNKLIVSSARTLTFPDVPRVSQEAKDLIQKCLEYHPADRYDVMQLSQDPYLQRNTRRPSRTDRTLPTGAQHLSTSTVAAAPNVALTSSIEDRLGNLP